MIPMKSKETPPNLDLFEQYVHKDYPDIPITVDGVYRKAELDALERYYPGGVERLVEEWMDKYYDDTLEDRCYERTQELLSETNDYTLPPEILAEKARVLSMLEIMVKHEADVELPESGNVVCDILPVTEEPSDGDWLMETRYRIYPKRRDIDCKDGDESEEVRNDE